LLDLTSKYFTKWINVLRSIFFSILFFALIYSLSPLINYLGFEIFGSIGGINYQIHNFYDICVFLGENIYFSTITFTTTGFGDLFPTGILRFFSGIEGFIGICLSSLFLVALAKKVLG
jgi:hypothetical protein